jgi:hypothetical protein
MAQFNGKYSQSSKTSPSPGVWGNCPINLATDGLSVHNDDFLTVASIDASGAAVTGNYATAGGHYEIYAHQGGTITSGSTVGGDIVVASDGDNEGIAIGPNVTAAFKITAANMRRLWFECRFKVDTIADTKNGVFIGLLEKAAVAAAVPITTSGTIADTNIIGFHRLEGDGDKMDVVYKADGQTQQTALADAVTLVADTYKKVGFYFDGLSTVKFYDDGEEVASARLDYDDLNAATFPSDVVLGPCIAIMNATGSTPGSLTVDWVRCVQDK